MGTSQSSVSRGKWRVLVCLIQLIFEHDKILVQMQCVIIVLLPKRGGNYQGIGLINLIHNMVQLMVGSRLEIIDFHDCLHSFLTGRAMGTVILEL